MGLNQNLSGLPPRAAVSTIASLIAARGLAGGVGQFAPPARFLPAPYRWFFAKTVLSLVSAAGETWLAMLGWAPLLFQVKQEHCFCSPEKRHQENSHPGSKKTTHVLYVYLCVCVFHVKLAAEENPWGLSVTPGHPVSPGLRLLPLLLRFPARGAQLGLNLRLSRETNSSADCSRDKPVLLLPSGGFKSNGASAPGIYHLEDTLLLSCDIFLHFYAHLCNCFL